MKQAWGKLRKCDDGQVVARYPLVSHCLDVAAVFLCLVTDSAATKSRLEALAGVNLSEDLILKLTYLVALHDCGKANSGFQSKESSDIHRYRGHVSEFLALLAAYEPPSWVAEVLRYEELLEWGENDDEIAVKLLIASVCHHGKPKAISDVEDKFEPEIWKETPHYSPRTALEELVVTSYSAILGRLDSQKDNATSLPTNPAFQHAFSGLVMLADWIASDTQFFPYTAMADASFDDRLDVARRTLNQTGIIATDFLKALRGAKELNFLETLLPHGAAASPLQDCIASMRLSASGQCTVVESATGSGKTEAALALAFRYMATGAVDGLYFALPSRTSAVQLRTRVYLAIKGLADKLGVEPPPVILAVPGYLEMDDHKGYRLPGFEVLWPDLEPSSKGRAWASEHSKRYLAGAIVIGTIDQLLLSAMQVSHAHMRMSSSMRHMLIVDEVHASDAYMLRILQEVLKIHHEAGASSVLLSATLTQDALEDLVGKPQVETTEKIPYPLVTNRANGAGKPTCISVPHYGISKAVVMELRATEDISALAELVGDAVRNGARVLCIRNTVSDAIQLYHNLSSTLGSGLFFRVNGVDALHHGRYAPADRKLLDDALEQQIGKSRKSDKKGLVVIATQTAEQSLDIDADFLITDICPGDVLLQRIGRLHRHRRDFRPLDYQRPKAIVLSPKKPLCAFVESARDGVVRGPYGIGTVYQNVAHLELVRCRIAREPMWCLPQENRDIVEATCSSAAQKALETDESWKRHAQAVRASTLMKKQLGGYALKDVQLDFGETRFQYQADETPLRTRLGEPSVPAHFPRSWTSPLGGKVRQINVPARWVQDWTSIEEPEIVEETPDHLTFRFGGQVFQYDHLGLHRSKGDT